MSNSTVLEQVQNLQSPYGFLYQKNVPELLLFEKENILSSMTDGVLSLVAPVFAYWAFSIFFHVIDVFHLAEQYRIHPSEEIASRNKVGRVEVLLEVIFQHIIQSVVGYTFYYFDPVPTTGFELSEMWEWKQMLPSYIPDIFIYYGYNYGISFCKIFAGFVIIDTWQYWLHRLMHTSTTLYKRFHSRHHRLYVPYAYGALYNAPLEGFLLDTLGAGIAMMITGLSHREQIILYTFSTMKTVDDHCGYALPFDLFQIVFPNNSVYHDIHHQNFGIKTNYAQPFFTFWDYWFGTKFEGVEEYKQHQRRITITKYKQFLANRNGDKSKKTK